LDLRNAKLAWQCPSRDRVEIAPRNRLYTSKGLRFDHRRTMLNSAIILMSLRLPGRARTALCDADCCTAASKRATHDLLPHQPLVVDLGTTCRFGTLLSMLGPALVRRYVTLDRFDRE